MIWLFDHNGKVTEAMRYAQALEAISTIITCKTYEVVLWYRMFTGLFQWSESFSVWWGKVSVQAEKCDYID